MDQVQKERERCLAIVRQAIDDNEQRSVRAVLSRIANEVADSISLKDHEPVREQRKLQEHRIAMVIAEELFAADNPDATIMLCLLRSRLVKERLSDWRIGEAVESLQDFAKDEVLESLLVRVHNRIIEELRSEES